MPSREAHACAHARPAPQSNAANSMGSKKLRWQEQLKVGEQRQKGFQFSLVQRKGMEEWSHLRKLPTPVSPDHKHAALLAAASFPFLDLLPLKQYVAKN